MIGEQNLERLLSSLNPSLIPGEFVFLTFADAKYGDHTELEPIATMAESEGLTLVVPKYLADKHDLDYESAFRGITLNVHSSLNAVGLTAAFSTKLAAQGISANVIAGHFHDHIFVATADAEKAIAVIEELAG